MQALKLVLAPRRRKPGDGRDRQRVVRRELRIQDVTCHKQSLRTDEITCVGRSLRGVDGKTGESPLLSPLDLAIPIRALHESDAHLPSGAASELGCPIDDECSAAPVSLDSEPQTVPVASRRVTGERFENVER